jgi:hypothetical protein
MHQRRADSDRPPPYSGGPEALRKASSGASSGIDVSCGQGCQPARHNRVVNEMAIARRIDGTVCFQHMRDALNAATMLDDAGFDVEILWERIDDYSDAGFMKVERYAHCDTDARQMPSTIRCRL